MPGRILIADDRFASRLMLAALFGGAYYEVVQADRADRVLPVARAERPGVVVISDGMANIGAAALCESLRRDPATTGALRAPLSTTAPVCGSFHCATSARDRRAWRNPRLHSSPNAESRFSAPVPSPTNGGTVWRAPCRSGLPRVSIWCRQRR